MTAKAFLLNDKVALIAGDSKLWAKPVAEALAKVGSNVVIASTASSRLTGAAQAAKAAGAKVLAIPTDVTRTAQVQNAVDKTLGEFGRIDILVNAMDVHFFQPFTSIQSDDWKKAMDYNFNSVLTFCRAVAPSMLERKNGRIISLVSGLSDRGIPNGSAYCVAMGSVLQLTRALALEWATTGVTVNAIGTGWFSESGAASDEKLARYIPLKRYGKPEEVGSLVVYLASDVTEFTTGQIMYVDGGLMAHA
ncbi:MAG: SDR family oxidoreductase [Proteobacteria bacterium]|nr:SDR family oxidoreductase [Pseudomonadota bacterium]MBU4469427.1 SDR family oxidoreductase [Pseudomonadota bacterium]MCG2752328.1 SDR family oxidoreductase [Desulfobacteraceae bacterium]